MNRQDHEEAFGPSQRPQGDQHDPDEETAELCEHGCPLHEYCEECAFWERVDYEYDRWMDK